MITFILFWIIIFVCHEFGHIVGFFIFRYEPSIKITWFGIEIGRNEILNCEVYEAYIITLLGIVFGFLPLHFLLGDATFSLLYFFMCSVDFSNLINYMNAKSQYQKVIELVRGSLNG